MSDEHDDDGHEVGYKKPPKRTRFSKGQSGNSNGRPKAADRLPADIAALLNEPIPVKKGGRITKVLPFEVGVRKLAHKSLNGDLGAALKFLKLCEKYSINPPPLAPPTGGGTVVVPKDVDDDAVIEKFNRFGPPPWPDADLSSGVDLKYDTARSEE